MQGGTDRGRQILAGNQLVLPTADEAYFSKLFGRTGLSASGPIQVLEKLSEDGRGIQPGSGGAHVRFSRTAHGNTEELICTSCIYGGFDA